MSLTTKHVDKYNTDMHISVCAHTHTTLACAPTLLFTLTMAVRARERQEVFERGIERRRVRVKEIWLHIWSHAASSFDYCSKRRLKWEHFHTLTRTALVLLRGCLQEGKPLTLPGLLQILVGLSCKAGRRTETSGLTTVTLDRTRANAVLLDTLASSHSQNSPNDLVQLECYSHCCHI